MSGMNKYDYAEDVLRVFEPDDVWFTSDTHFYHENILRYCNRPFRGIAEMNETLVRNWNEVVPPDGVVFHLGDFAFGSPSQWNDILSRLNGQIYLILGNHDMKQIRQGFMGRFAHVTQQNALLVLPNHGQGGAHAAQIRPVKLLLIDHQVRFFDAPPKVFPGGLRLGQKAPHQRDRHQAGDIAPLVAAHAVRYALHVIFSRHQQQRILIGRANETDMGSGCCDHGCASRVKIGDERSFFSIARTRLRYRRPFPGGG